MTSDLSARLSDPTPSLTLSDRLSDPNRLTLADRLGVEDHMEVDLAPEETLMGNPIIPRGQLTRNMPDANAPYQHTAMRDSTPIRDTTDDEATVWTSPRKANWFTRSISPYHFYDKP